MKKNLKIIIVLLLVCVICINVNAETVWPQMVTTGDYKMIIDGIYLKIYDYEKDTHTDPYQDLFDETPKKSVYVEVEKETFNPTLIKTTEDDRHISILSLNLDIPEEKITNILKEEIPISIGDETDEDDTTNYELYEEVEVELVARVKLIETPSNFTHIKKNSISKGFLYDILDDAGYTYSDDFNLNDFNDVVIYRINVDRDEEELDINYCPIDEFFDCVDFIGESNLENSIALSAFEESDIIDVLEYENVEYTREAVESSKVVNNNPETSISTDQVVKVPNTELNIEKYKYIISIGVLAIGLFLVFKTTSKKKKA